MAALNMDLLRFLDLALRSQLVERRKTKGSSVITVAKPTEIKQVLHRQHQFAMCFLTTRCDEMLHTRPLNTQICSAFLFGNRSLLCVCV